MIELSRKVRPAPGRISPSAASPASSTRSLKKS